MAEQPAAVRGVRQLDAPEVAAVHPGDAIVPGQPLVQEAVTGREQFGDAVLVTDIGYTRNMMRTMVTLKDEAARAERAEKGRLRARDFSEERTAQALHDALDEVISA